MWIGELAERSGFSRDAIRFYEREGLIHPHRGPQGYREYDQDTLRRLELIARAKSMGFTLAEASELLEAWISHRMSVEEKRKILTGKVEAIDQRVKQMLAAREQLLAAFDEITEGCEG